MVNVVADPNKPDVFWLIDDAQHHIGQVAGIPIELMACGAEHQSRRLAEKQAYMFSLKHGIHRADYTTGVDWATGPDYTAEVTIDGKTMQVVGIKLMVAKPQPPAYLRKPNRAPWRWIIRAALGQKYATGHYRFHVECRHDGPTVKRYMAQRAEYRRRTD